MNSSILETRVTAAHTLVTQLADTVGREGYDGVVWHRKLLDIRDVLDETGRPARERLSEAAHMLDALYEGPRNFADFHIYRDDPSERVAEDERLSTLVGELTTTLQAEQN